MAPSRILQEVHNTASELHKGGIISDITMRNYDKLCMAPVHEMHSEDIQKLRERERISQAVLAACLNISVSTVQKWEGGSKKPSGLALTLLNLIERKGLDALFG